MIDCKMSDEEQQEHTAEDVEELVTSSESSTHQLTYPGSIEQQIFVDSGFKDGSYNAVRAFYGSALSYLRAPTAIRKLINCQTFKQRENLSLWTDTNSEPTGTLIGGILGFAVPIVYCFFKDYNPTKLLLISNAVVGAFELGRLGTSKKENLEMKAQREILEENLETKGVVEEQPTEKPEDKLLREQIDAKV